MPTETERTVPLRTEQDRERLPLRLALLQVRSQLMMHVDAIKGLPRPRPPLYLIDLSLKTIDEALSK